MTDKTIAEGLENQPKPNQKEKDTMPVVKEPAEVAVGEPTELEGKLPNSNVNPDPINNTDTSVVMGNEPTSMEGKLPNSKVNPDPMNKIKMEAMEIDDDEEKEKVLKQDLPKGKLSEDIKGLLESIELPEEFKTKALGLFEGAVAGQVADIKKEILAVNEVSMTEYKATLTEKVEAQTDSYVSEAVAKWLEENQTNVKSNVRTQLAESFIANLLNLLESHYITIPEGKEDILEVALTKADELQKQLDESLLEIQALKDSAMKASKTLVVESLVKSLTDTQAERVRELAESIVFDTKEVYQTKLEAIVESITKTDATKPSDFLTEDAKGEVVIKEQQSDSTKEKVIDPFVANLLADMKRIAK